MRGHYCIATRGLNERALLYNNVLYILFYYRTYVFRFCLFAVPIR